MNNVCAVILAAGKGTRMNSNKPKVLHKIAGQPLIYWPLKLLQNAGINKVVVVVGYKAGLVKNTIENLGFNCDIVEQKEQLGTAHSLETGLKTVPKECKNLLVLYGDDAVLYEAETILSFINYHENKNNKVTLLTSERKIPTDIGGLKKDRSGNVIGVMTLSMITKSKLKTHEVLCGAFCFDKDWVEKALQKIKPSTLSGEYPLPGIIEVAKEEKVRVDTFKLSSNKEWRGINTPDDLKEAEKIKLSLVN